MTAYHPDLPATPVYLDYNATTPVDPRVLQALVPGLRETFGNPSSEGCTWVQVQRRKGDQLTVRRRELLEALPGWAWRIR